MPKRKATGPAESDGEDEEFYSFSASPIQSPFVKSVPNHVNHLAPQSIKFNFNSIGGVGGGGNFSSEGSTKIGNAVSHQTSATTPFFSQSLASSSVTPLTIKDSPSVRPMTAKKPRNSDFDKSMKDLNKSFIASVRTTIKSNPSHSLVPVVKDYLYHSRVLMEKFKRGSSGELYNGINVPSKSFRSLGEFFDDFEHNYVDLKEDTGDKSTNSTPRSSAHNKSDSLSTLSSDTSVKSNSTLGFAASSNNPFSENTSGNASPEAVKLSPISSKLASSPLNTKSNAEIPRSSNFLTTSFPSLSRPLQINSPTGASIGSGSTLGMSPMKSTPAAGSSMANKQPRSTSPAATFAGFSFFKTPSSSGPATTSLMPVPETTTSNSDDKKNEEGGEDGEEDEPPKVEITQVKEDDAVYSKRCKVFGVVDGKCKDKGVGMLYVKKIEAGKYQIVVRADNNLGTVILNILLQKSLPLEKNSKNSVMTVDLGANAKKGMPVIIKVKTEEDAIELLEKLKEYQQES